MLKTEILTAIQAAIPALRVLDREAAEIKAVKAGHLAGDDLANAKSSVTNACEAIMDEFSMDELSRPKFGLVEALKSLGESSPELQEFGASRSAQATWSRSKRARVNTPEELAKRAAIQAMLKALVLSDQPEELAEDILSEALAGLAEAKAKAKAKR